MGCVYRYKNATMKKMKVIYLLEIILPTIIAIGLHNYFCHGKMSFLRKIIFACVYFCMLNYVVLTLIKGCNDGVFDFESVSNISNIRILLTGCNLAFELPLIMCLLFEKDVTLAKLKRYLHRIYQDIRRYFGYSVRSAKADLRSEVANAYLDWLWWLIEPFCTMLIYTLIYGIVFHISIDFFPIFIFSGIAMWSFFSRGLSVSVDIVRINKPIITKIYLPKFILLLSRNFVNAFKMLVSFGIVVLMMIFYKVPITGNIWYAVPAFIVFFILTFGIGTILMHFGVYVSDLAYITGILLNMLMYFTGTFYSIEQSIPAPYNDILGALNPVAFCIDSVRKALLYGQPTSFKMLVLWGNLGIAFMVIGIYIIYRNENAYVKVI